MRYKKKHSVGSEMRIKDPRCPFAADPRVYMHGVVVYGWDRHLHEYGWAEGELELYDACPEAHVLGEKGIAYILRVHIIEFQYEMRSVSCKLKAHRYIAFD